MQNAFWKFVLIFVILGGCLWAINPPEDNIRLGRDLSGGVSLVYSVRMPEGGDRATMLAQTIQVLNERVNPQGVLDISMTPLGTDRIEVVMPLPNEEVKALGQAYRTTLDDFIGATEIRRSDLERALAAGTAPTDFGTEGERGAMLVALQDASTQVQQLKAQVAAATASGDTAQLNTARQSLADAEIEVDNLTAEVMGLSLDRSRVVRVLELANSREVSRDAAGEIIVDANGRAVLEPSPRDVALANLRTEFPAAASGLDQVLADWEAYQVRRTGLDDPEDLMRLLQGAGVLHFHIGAVVGKVQGVDIEDMRAQLAEVGPDNTDSAIAAWFPIHDLKQWVDSPEDLAALEADPVGFFAGRAQPLVAAERDGVYYLLLYTGPGKSMTHEGETSWSVEGTGRTTDELGRPAVSFRLDASGGGIMTRLTQPHVGHPMAIVLDGKVYTAPNLQSTIPGNGIITGNYSNEELEYLMRVLTAGSLEARLSPEPIAVSVLGPSLGADNLSRGLQAFIWAVLVVGVFMVLWYFLAGMVADAALLFNGVIIFGVMAMMQGTFTLPGLAGVVLTMGMAVDANVLIYERIREEIEAGARDLRSAVRDAYNRVYGTILDANITNLVVCAVLLLMEPTTEVKGFALTLTIGIIATLFTALFVTRFLFDIYMYWFGGRKLPMLPGTIASIGRALRPSTDWVGKRGLFWTVSGLAITASIFLFFNRGVELFDTEFRGGVAVTMETGTNDQGQPIYLSQTGADSVTHRVHAIGEAAGQGEDLESRVRREMRNAKVLTVGETIDDGSGRTVGRSFQVKVAAPAGTKLEEGIQDIVEAALLEQFRDELNISPGRTFQGMGTSDWAAYTRPVNAGTVGELLGLPNTVGELDEHQGGVIILAEGIEPAITLDEVLGRVDRLRQDPDFSDTVGRDVAAFGLAPAGDDTWSSVVVAVSDPDINYIRSDSALVDQRLAQREWSLISSALARQSSFEQVSSFAPAVAATRTANAIGAVILSLAGILFYIWVRFGSLRYSLAAIAALCHDVIIVVGFLALSGVIAGQAWASGGLLIEEFQIDTGIVAALLTVIGYSLNDTIVILDRIRENRGKRPIPSKSIVNNSINQAFSRTVLTSVTTLIAVLIIYVAGGTGIRGFAYALVIGVIVGTYSSIAIASPLVFSNKQGESRRPSPDDADSPEALPERV